MGQSESEFREGDRVILVQEFTFGGYTKQANPSLMSVPVGSIGWVIDLDWGETRGHRTVLVRWETGVPEDHGGEPEFGVDEHRLALLHPLPDFSSLQEVDAWLRS